MVSLLFEKGIEKTVMWYLFSKTYPSFLTVKEGSTSHLGLLPSGKKREIALLGARNRYALRLADHQRSSPDYAGWDRLDVSGDTTSDTASTVTSSTVARSSSVANSSFAASSSSFAAAIDRVQEELKELGLWKFVGGIMYIMQEVFGMPASRLIVPPNEKYGKFVLNEVLEAGNFGKHDARNRFGRSQLGHNL